MKPFVAKGEAMAGEPLQCDASRAKESHLSLAILNRSGRLVLLAAITTLGLSSAVIAADAPTPIIEHTGNWRTAVHRFVEANMKHPAWGLSHSMRDYELAKALAAADQVTVDDDVLYAAAYLHDVAAFAPFRKPGVDHQDEAARIVESMLAGTGFPMAKIEAVRGAIRTHMFGRDPVGPEAIYLHDADALDWLGAIGVARSFGLVDPKGGKPTGPEAVEDLEHSLKDVPPRIVSKAGKALTPQRVRELEQFLHDLRAESGDLKSL
jgi:uncharacterized protein